MDKSTPLIFTAELPWIGPIVGGIFAGEGRPGQQVRPDFEVRESLCSRRQEAPRALKTTSIHVTHRVVNVQ